MSKQNQEITGYPSIDKPWLKYYNKEFLSKPFPQCTVYEYLYENNKNYLSEKKLEYYGHKFSYAEIFDEIEKYRKAFLNLGVKQGDIIAFASVTTPELIFSLYALNRIGAVMNIIDPRTQAKGLQAYLRECHCRFLFGLAIFIKEMESGIVGTDVEKVFIVNPNNYLPKVKKVFAGLKNPQSFESNSNKIVKWEDFIELYKKPLTTEIPDVTYQGDMPVCIAHTGGTTGISKGVLLTNDNFNGIAHQIRQCNFGWTRDDVFLNVTVPFVAMGVINALHHFLAIGVRMIIIPLFKPEMSKKLIEKYNPTIMIGAPSYFSGVLEVNKTRLRYPIAGAEATKVEFEKALNDKLAELGCDSVLMKGYGMTEMSAVATVSFHKNCNKIGSVGVPLPETVLAVIDPDTGNELAYNQLGEICMKGPGMMSEYYCHAEETAKIKRLHDDGDYWIHSGDIGYIDEDGLVFIVNRIKRIFTVDGFKVYPSRLEELLLHCAEIRECSVIGVEGEDSTCDVVLFIVKEGEIDNEVLERKIKEMIADSDLPQYYNPTSYVYLDKLPINNAGKVDVIFLKEKYLEKKH